MGEFNPERNIDGAREKRKEKALALLKATNESRYSGLRYPENLPEIPPSIHRLLAELIRHRELLNAVTEGRISMAEFESRAETNKSLLAALITSIEPEYKTGFKATDDVDLFLVKDLPALLAPLGIFADNEVLLRPNSSDQYGFDAVALKLKIARTTNLRRESAYCWGMQFERQIANLEPLDIDGLGIEAFPTSPAGNTRSELCELKPLQIKKIVEKLESNRKAAATFGNATIEDISEKYTQEGLTMPAVRACVTDLVRRNPQMGRDFEEAEASVYRARNGTPL